MHPEKTYEDGIIEGRIQEHEKILGIHDDRISLLEGRARAHERVMNLAIGGAIALQVVMPMNLSVLPC